MRAQGSFRATDRKAAMRFTRPVVLLCSLALCFGAGVSAIDAPAVDASVTTHTPVMGPPLLNASQLAGWYYRHSGSHPRIPVFHDNVAQLAQVFIDEGKAEGVRGDIAFVQSMLETGWLGFVGSQIPPDAYNYAGIFAFDGRPGLTTCVGSHDQRCMGTPQHGALMQMQLLRSYADPATRNMPGRLISAPSDRVGAAPLWEYFGGHNCPCGKLIWASADDYGLIIIKMYSQALAESGLAGACVPYAPPHSGPSSGSGYWEISSDYVVHPFGDAHFYGDPHTSASHLPPIANAEAMSNMSGYWIVRKDGGVHRYGSAVWYGGMNGKHLNRPINGMERTADNKGYWLVADDGGIFGFGDVHFFGSMGGKHLNKPIYGMERSATGNGYWQFASDGGIFGFGDAQFYGSLASRHLPYPVVAMQRTNSGNGYWMLTLDGQVFPFGDAKWYGDIAGCSNLGGATRMLVTPDGKGYWIATGAGAVIPFGSARSLGFPQSINGYPAALIGGN
jgi:hypothetical protein